MDPLPKNTLEVVISIIYLNIIQIINKLNFVPYIILYKYTAELYCSLSIYNNAVYEID